MVKYYWCKVLAFTIVSICSIDFLSAQTVQYLNSNNIIAGIGIGGNLFCDTFPRGNTGLFKTRFDSGKIEINTAALWMTGYDESSNLVGAGQMHGEFGRDYFDGPIANIYDSIYDNYYKRVFKITQAQISSFRSLSFPAIENQVDSAILYWPGKGNPEVLSKYGVNINSALAPFTDLNNNGIYEPLLGDYPGICGDEAIFFVFNDARGSHTECDCNKLGVEIRGLSYSFSDTINNLIPYNKKAVNNTIFVKYDIENKSNHTYTSFDFGQWIDPDLGCYTNDDVGCDSLRNLMFVYNRSSFDANCNSVTGFDNLPITVGVQFLNSALDVFGTFKGYPAAQADPGTVCGRYRNYQEGLWCDDSPFEFGKDGYYTGYDTLKLLFSGDPNDTSQWSEYSAHALYQNSEMFGCVNSLNFLPGQINHLDLAYTTSFDLTSNFLSIVDTLKRDADVIRAFYNNQIEPCQNQFALGILNTQVGNVAAVSLFPNPANSQVTIQCTSEIQSIQLMDIDGRVLIGKVVGAKNFVLPVNNLAKGVYLVNVLAERNVVVKKLVVE